MESADKENETPNRQCLKGKHCRRAGKTRLTGSRRKDKSAEPRHTMMSTLTSFLNIIGCMSCPIAAASISSTTRRKIGYRNRRQRRAAGERNIKRRLMFKSGTEYHTPVRVTLVSHFERVQRLQHLHVSVFQVSIPGNVCDVHLTL